MNHIRTQVNIAETVLWKRENRAKSGRAENGSALLFNGIGFASQTFGAAQYIAENQLAQRYLADPGALTEAVAGMVTISGE